MNATRIGKPTVMSNVFVSSIGFHSSVLFSIQWRREVADVPILWAMVPREQWLFLALNLCLNNKCNRLLALSTHVKTGIKKYIILFDFLTVMSQSIGVSDGHFIYSYSGLSLSQIRKRLRNQFEVERVWDKEKLNFH